MVASRKSFPFLLLIGRFNIVVVERDYSSLRTGRSYLHFADITVDVRSGICLRSLNDLIFPAQLQEMCDKVFAFHQKFTHFSLILCPEFSSHKYVHIHVLNIATVVDCPTTALAVVVYLEYGVNHPSNKSVYKSVDMIVIDIATL